MTGKFKTGRSKRQAIALVERSSLTQIAAEIVSGYTDANLFDTSQDAPCAVSGYPDRGGLSPGNGSDPNHLNVGSGLGDDGAPYVVSELQQGRNLTEILLVKKCWLFDGD